MATLTLSIKEDLIIAGKQQGRTVTKEVTSVNNVFCRYYVVDNTEDTIIDFQADRSSGGAVEDGTLKYARFTKVSGHCSKQRVYRKVVCWRKLPVVF